MGEKKVTHLLTTVLSPLLYKTSRVEGRGGWKGRGVGKGSGEGGWGWGGGWVRAGRLGNGL